MECVLTGTVLQSGPGREPSLPPPPLVNAEEPELEPPPKPTSSFAEVRIVDGEFDWIPPFLSWCLNLWPIEVRDEEPEVEVLPETAPEEVNDEDVVQETPEAESSVIAAAVETATENVPEASPIAASPRPPSRTCARIVSSCSPLMPCGHVESLSRSHEARKCVSVARSYGRSYRGWL